jgi:hypothetical protein
MYGAMCVARTDGGDEAAPVENATAAPNVTISAATSAVSRTVLFRRRSVFDMYPPSTTYQHVSAVGRTYLLVTAYTVCR